MYKLSTSSLSFHLITLAWNKQTNKWNKYNPLLLHTKVAAMNTDGGKTWTFCLLLFNFMIANRNVPLTLLDNKIIFAYSIYSLNDSFLLSPLSCNLWFSVIKSYPSYHLRFHVSSRIYPCNLTLWSMKCQFYPTDRLKTCIGQGAKLLCPLQSRLNAFIRVYLLSPHQEQQYHTNIYSLLSFYSQQK